MTQTENQGGYGPDEIEVTPAMLKAGGGEVSLWLRRNELEVGPYTAQIIAQAAFEAMLEASAAEHSS